MRLRWWGGPSDGHAAFQTRPRTTGIVAGIGVAGFLAGAAIAGSSDPGADYNDLLSAKSQPLFGFGHPLDAGVAGTFDGPGDEAVELAKGLKATLVTDAIGRRADMIALWPDDAHPTHAIICNEIDTANPNAGGSPNPDFGKATVQRVRLSDGEVTDMMTGHNACDPARRTAWGTILVGEENGPTGRLWEILDPLDVAGVTVNRAAGTTSDPAHVVARLGLGQLSYEGVVALPDGTTYYGDELRPSNGRVGGGVFKFVPTTPWAGGDPITSLDQSPLAAGRVSVLRLASPNRNFNDAGQGTNTGAGRWVPLTTPANPLTFNLAAVAIAAGGYTGFYRPEDFELDPAPGPTGTSGSAGTTPATTGRTSGARRSASATRRPRTRRSPAPSCPSSSRSSSVTPSCGCRTTSTSSRAPGSCTSRWTRPPRSMIPL